MRNIRRGLAAAAWLALALPPPATAIAAIQPGSPASAAPACSTAQERPRTILFIGNSFTQGAHSAVRNWRAHKVTDLNQTGYGGVPALFKTFTEQAGLDYAVALETQGGRSLGFHYDERRHLFDRHWDVVVLQEYSTLDRERPGDPANYFRDVGRLSSLFKARNRAVDIQLMATWTRADQTFRPGGHWFGRPVTAMADDLHSAAERARSRTREVRSVLPVGKAWNRAFAYGVADGNPYDGVSFGKLNLWASDQYHASIAGYYLEALVVFGAVTGIDPTVLGAKEKAADELGLSIAEATALQRVARDELRQCCRKLRGKPAPAAD